MNALYLNPLKLVGYLESSEHLLSKVLVLAVLSIVLHLFGALFVTVAFPDMPSEIQFSDPVEALVMAVIVAPILESGILAASVKATMLMGAPNVISALAAAFVISYLHHLGDPTLGYMVFGVFFLHAYVMSRLWEDRFEHAIFLPMITHSLLNFIIVIGAFYLPRTSSVVS